MASLLDKMPDRHGRETRLPTVELYRRLVIDLISAKTTDECMRLGDEFHRDLQALIP